jgi:hypothetical protein
LAAWCRLQLTVIGASGEANRVDVFANEVALSDTQRLVAYASILLGPEGVPTHFQNAVATLPVKLVTFPSDHEEEAYEEFLLLRDREEEAGVTFPRPIRRADYEALTRQAWSYYEALVYREGKNHLDLRRLARDLCSALNVLGEIVERCEQSLSQEKQPALGGKAHPPTSTDVEGGVLRYFKDHPQATLLDSAASLGISADRVSKTSAWQAEVENRAKAYMRANPDATCKQLGAAIGCSTTKAHTLGAWKQRRKQRLIATPEPEIRTRRLTKKILSVIGGRDSIRPDPLHSDYPPEKIAAAFEQFWQLLLSITDEGAKRRLKKLRPPQREELMSELAREIPRADLDGAFADPPDERVLDIIRTCLDGKLEQYEDDC